MIFHFHGTSRPAELRGAFEAVTNFLSAHSVDSVNSLMLNGIVWSGEERLQVKQGVEITHVSVWQHDGKWSVAPHGIVERRPKDMPFNPLALMMNHDD